MLKFCDYLDSALISEAIEYHRKNSIPFDECVFRYGSEKYFQFFTELKALYNSGRFDYIFSEEEREILESDIGEFVEFEGTIIPLDFIMEEESPELNSPKRGGPKKFYVMVRDPETKNIKKVSFGDTTGLSVKYDNPERKKAFAARHNCADKTDKTSPGYWACRVNKYMAKTSAGRSGYW